MKKIGAIITAFLMLAGFAACESSNDGTESETVTGKLSDVDIWGAAGTEKILRDVHGIYDDVRTDAAVSVTAARGEYEGAHIIVTADKAVTYDAAAYELVAQDGTKFSAGQVEIFVEKYIRVTANFENNGMPIGDYPDALVPMYAIKNAGENKIEESDNQGLYVRFNVPVGQKAGVYTGKIVLTIGTENKEIPVTLNVVDAVVSQENHMRSIFLNQWSFDKGELDSTQEMMDKYTEALFEYRLNPDTIMLENDSGEAGISAFVEKAYEYMQNPKCANVSVPYASVWRDGTMDLDNVYFDNVLTAVAKKSFETNYDMFAKLVCYFGIIDEPQQNGLFDRVKTVITTYRKKLTEVADRLEADSTVTSPKKAEIIDSLRNLRNVVTSSYESALAEYVDTWCPQFQYYDSASGREDYASQEEKWWYGCVSPRAPYPTYHTDDTLLSARVVSWMQAEYNVKGNLFWATDVYARYNGATYVDIEDYYGGSASRFPNVNGDGYLFYPGKKYGIDGPVGSLRLEAIRDGIEEYELLISLKENYSEINNKLGDAYSFDDSTLSRSLSEFIYSGTKVSATSETFAEARNSLLQLSALGQSEAGFCFTDYEDNGYGEKTYRFVAAKGAQIKNNGAEITDKQNIGDYTLYTVVDRLQKDENSLNLRLEINGNTYEYTQNLGGKVIVHEAKEASTGDFGKEGVKPTVELDESGFEKPCMKVTLPAVSEDGEQSFRLSGKLIEGVGENTNKLVLHVYYGGEDQPEAIISGKYSGSRIYGDIANVKLQNGLNTIELSLASKNWEKLGDLEYLCFIFNDGTTARTIHVIDSIVYSK